MSDDDLLAKLGQLGFDVQGKALAEGFRDFISAEAMSDAMIAGLKTRIPEEKVDWVWIGLKWLWEGWERELRKMEMVEDGMEEG